MSKIGLVYITLAGGGLFISDAIEAIMKIVGEYGINIVYGAGCGGGQVESGILLNPGVSASGAGAAHFMFGLPVFSEADYVHGYRIDNDPIPSAFYRDESNTLTGVNVTGRSEYDMSGRMPGTTPWRDSHGVVVTIDGIFAPVVDRLQNAVESFNVRTFERSTYDLTKKSEKLEEK